MAARRAGVLRLLGLVVAGGALVTAAAGTDVTFGTVEAGPADLAAVSAAADPGSYPGEAVLACPGVAADGEQDGEQGDEQGAQEQDDEQGAQEQDDEEATSTPGTRVRVVGAPPEVFDGAAAPTGASGLELALVGDDGADDVEADAAGTVAASLEDGSWGVVRARGEQAAGVVAGQLSMVPDAGARGWALAPCSVPTDVVHLVGGGEGAGRVELVVVANPSSDPVTVDLEVFGEDGRATTVGGSGLVVPPESRLVQRLEAIAPSARHPVVRVVARGGPVTAYLADRERSGTTDLGRELVAAAAAPATELVLPALPGYGEREHTRTLRLFAPGAEAVVELRALTEEGARVPDPAVVRVPAGSTVEVEMADLPDGPSALRLRSDAPVTAGALLQVAPASDEPLVLEEKIATTAGPDVAASTEGPDDAVTTAGPDAAVTTAGPDDAATTAGPDDAASTAGPDDAATTAGPVDAPAPQAEPVLRPAGESAWVAAVPLSRVPLGMALPDLTDPPGPAAEGPDEGSAALAVSAVDATTATVLFRDDRGRVRSEELVLANDTTLVLGVPDRTVALWVLPAEDVGVAAALHLAHQDAVGPYLTAATVPQVPWTREVPSVVPVLP